jgi:TolA-binding protein
MKKIIFAVGILLFGSFALAAQSGSGLSSRYAADEQFWYTLELGKSAYRQGDFARALSFFEDARNKRLAKYYSMERSIADIASLDEARRFGDDLSRLENYIKERNHFDAGNALAELYYRVPKESLQNSIKAAMAQFSRLQKYPEADYWIAEVYRVEGESALAEKQYLTAYDAKANLEAPDFATTILYRLADVQKQAGKYNAMERTLLEIQSYDSFWPSGQYSEQEQRAADFARQAMKRTVENDGINRFLLMYRYTNSYIGKAHRLLGEYYYNSGRHAKAEEYLLFAVLYASSAVIEEYKNINSDWNFTTLDEFFQNLDRHSEIRYYLRESEYYKTLYMLAVSLHTNGKTNSAREIWSFLSGCTEAGEWRPRAAQQLRSPFVEKAIIAP